MSLALTNVSTRLRSREVLIYASNSEEKGHVGDCDCASAVIRGGLSSSLFFVVDCWVDGYVIIALPIAKLVSSTILPGSTVAAISHSKRSVSWTLCSKH